MTQIVIISGFLGAGKTTFIDRLLKGFYNGRKIAIIENDFGDFSLDSSLLRQSGFEVTDIKSGCICCTLSGDFITALCSLTKSKAPEVIVIEPSGVGKLSDVQKACNDQKLRGLALISNKITIVDVNRCETYYENFGEFFDDQIKNADTVVLSRTQLYPHKCKDAISIVRKLNANAIIYDRPFDELDFNEILTRNNTDYIKPSEDCICTCHMHSHDKHCHCDHNSSEHHHTFDTVTVIFNQDVTQQLIKRNMERLSDSRFGDIVRAKGIITQGSGFLNVQYVPGSVTFEKTEVHGNEICFIGKGLDKTAIRELFSI